MNIRTATIDDAEKIARLVCDLTTRHVAPSLGDGGIQTLHAKMDAASTRERMTNGWPHFCAFDDNAIAGVAVVSPPTHLYHFFVATDLHRTGVGRKLFSVAEQWSLSTNSKPLQTVNSSLNAVDVYKRFGFETTGPVVDSGGVRYQPMQRTNDA